MPVELKCTEVMLSVWVIVLGGVTKLGNPLDQVICWNVQLFQQMGHASSDKPLP
jgi:hypothetical protein